MLIYIFINIYSIYKYIYHIYKYIYMYICIVWLVIHFILEVWKTFEGNTVMEMSVCKIIINVGYFWATVLYIFHSYIHKYIIYILLNVRQEIEHHWIIFYYPYQWLYKTHRQKMECTRRHKTVQSTTPHSVPSFRW